MVGQRINVNPHIPKQTLKNTEMKQQGENLKSFSFNMTRTFSFLMTEDASQRNSVVVEQEQDSRNLTDEF